MADQGRQVAEPNDATPFLPERRSLKSLREAAGGCRGCHLWRHATLGEELRQVKPEALVLLGATAAKALLGASFRITRERGRPLDSDLADLVLATAHPSSILRQRTDEERHEERRLLVEDLRVVAEAL